MSDFPDLNIGQARAVATATGDLGTPPRRARERSGRARVLRLLNRVFDRSPRAVLALRINAPANSPGGLRWKIAEAPALEDRTLFVQCSGLPDLTVRLEGRTVASVRDTLAARGIVLAYSNPDPEVLNLSALALVPGEGEEWRSNGDHLHVHTSLLWSWADPVGRWLDRSRLDIGEMLRMLVVRQSGGAWSELWASYFGLRRRGAETDDRLNLRTEYEWRRPRNNARAMELNIRVLTGSAVEVREPWKEMMVVSGSVISGDHHLPNEKEFAYHRAQLRSRAFVDWDLAGEEAEADRPAGTLLLAPVTTPWPWFIECPEPGLDFGLTTEHAARIQDFDGQIISVNWSLSNSFVMLNPKIAIAETLDFQAGPLDGGGDLANRRTIAVGSMVVSEQHPLGHEQNRLSGRMRVEEGEPMVASGGAALSDYGHKLVYKPVDEWLVDARAYDPPAPLALPAQAAIEGEAGIAFAVEHEPEEPSAATSFETALELPIAFADPWLGAWDERTWEAAYPSPQVAFGVSDPTLAGAAVASASFAPAVISARTLIGGGGTARAVASGTLTTSIRLSGSAQGLASAAASFTAPVLLVGAAQASASAMGELLTDTDAQGSAVSRASASGVLTTSIRLAGQALGQASGTALFSDNRIFAAGGAQAVATGTLRVGARFTAAAQGEASATGALRVGARLSGSGSGLATATGNLRVGVKLAGAAIGGPATATGTLTSPSTATAYDTTGLTVWMQPDSAANRTIDGGAWSRVQDSRGTGASAFQPEPADRAAFITYRGRAMARFGATADGGVDNLYFEQGNTTDDPGSFYRFFSDVRTTRTISAVVLTPAAWPTDADTLPIIGTWWWGVAGFQRVLCLAKIGTSWRPCFAVTDVTGAQEWRHPSSGALAPNTLYHVTLRLSNGVADFFINGVAQGMNATGALTANTTAHPDRGGAIGAGQISNNGANDYRSSAGMAVGDILIRDGVALTQAQASAEAAVTTSRYPA